MARLTPEVVKRVEELARLCAQRGSSLGLAESCTGGLLSSWICAYPGASAFYRGGVVCYSANVKSDVLLVPQTLLKAHGEVSLPVAKAMALGAREALQVTWAASITGVAGPSGGTVTKPVGFVCFAVVGPGFEEATQHVFPVSGGRQEIQRQAALFAFDLLLNAIR